MAIEFIAKFDRDRLSPVSAAEHEAMMELAGGAEYRVTCTRVSRRSAKHMRFLFALIKIARENYDEPLSSDAIKEVLKIRTGHVHVVKSATGEMIMFPASISFEKMDQDAFNKWFPRAVDVLCRDFCPGLDKVLAMREIEREAGVVFSEGKQE